MQRTSIYAVLLVVLLCSSAPAGQEAELIGVLQSDAGRKEKADACRDLALVGGREAVPVLAGLLADEELSNMARYALEPIRDPSVDEALRDALGRLQGRLLVGVIGSIGVRRDAGAVVELGALLSNSDAEVAAAAARALGSIGAKDAVEVLERALPCAPDEVRPDFCEGLLRCAESMLATGETVSARRVYELLRESSFTPAVRMAALRGAIIVRGRQDISLLLASLKADDYALFATALGTTQDVPGQEITGVLAGALNDLSAERRMAVIGTLGTRRDPAASAALESVARVSAKGLRVAAIQSLGQIGAASSVPALAGLSDDTEPEVAAAAQAALAALPGRESEDAIIAMLEHEDLGLRTIAADLCGQRHLAGALPVLLRSAADPDPALSGASLKALAVLAGRDEIPALVELLIRTDASKEVEKTLASIITRPTVAEDIVIQKALYGVLSTGPMADVTARVEELVKSGSPSISASNAIFGDPAGGVLKQLRVDYTANGIKGSKTVNEGETLALPVSGVSTADVRPLCRVLPNASVPVKLALLRLLRATGDPQSLAAVRAATADRDVEVRVAAWRALCDWPTPNVLGDLVRFVKSTDDQTLKILAVRGCLRLVQQQPASIAEKLEIIQDILALIDRPDEKRLALAVLGSMPDVNSLRAVIPYTNDAALIEESCQAAVAIARGLALPHPPEVVEAMRNVIKQSSDTQLVQAARAVLERAGE